MENISFYDSESHATSDEKSLMYLFPSRFRGGIAATLNTCAGNASGDGMTPTFDFQHNPGVNVAVDINNFSDLLPDYINVFCILVPSAVQGTLSDGGVVLLLFRFATR